MTKNYLYYTTPKKLREFVKKHFGDMPDELNLDYEPSISISKNKYLGYIISCDYVENLNDFEPDFVVRTVYIGQYGIIKYSPDKETVMYIPATQDAVYKPFFEFMFNSIKEYGKPKLAERYKKDFVLAHKKVLNKIFRKAKRNVKFNYKEELERLSFEKSVEEDSIIQEFLPQNKK